MPRITKDTFRRIDSNRLFWIVVMNAWFVFLFIMADQELWNRLNSFGLNGSWQLLTINLQSNISGNISTYPNTLMMIFLGNVIGNVFWVAVSYRSKK